MDHRELDRLLAGAEAVTMTLRNPEGRLLAIHLDREALGTSSAMRQAVRDQGGWDMPVYDQRDHDAIVRALFMAVDAATTSEVPRAA